MLVGKKVFCGGRLFLAAGMLLLGTHLALADEDDSRSRVVNTSSPERVESQRPADPEAAARVEILKSDAMLEALIWWDEYIAATAADDEKEHEELEARIAKMSAVELRKFLLKFQRDRELAKERQASVNNNRQQQLAFRQTYVRQQQAARQAALKRAGYGNRRYFDTTQRFFGGTTPSPRRRHRVVRPPLVTSLSVARYAVHRSLWGRRW